MKRPYPDILSLFTEDAPFLKGIFNVIEYLGYEKFFQIYYGRDKIQKLKGKKNKNSFADKNRQADDLLDKINDY